MQTQVFNPAIPFELPLHSVRPGMMFTVHGRPTGNRFGINLRSGPTDRDIAFHFNPRFNEHAVVRNSRVNGTWQTEERGSPLGFPFVMHQPFQVIVLIQQNSIKVAVNGKHFVEFFHRLPISRITTLHLGGQAAIDKVVVGYDTPAVTSIQNPVNESAIQIPIGNIRGRTINVSGTPQARPPNKFTIQFLCGGHPNADIGLVFAGRINEGVVVRNSRMNGQWQAEERQLNMGFPFQYNVPFQLTFEVSQRCFTVKLNGGFLCEFLHRKRPLNQITHIKFGGAAYFSSATFQ